MGKKNITENFGQLFKGYGALIFRAHRSYTDTFDVQAYRMDENGFLTDGHPLQRREAETFGRILLDGASQQFLRSNGLLPQNVRYVDTSGKGKVIWTSPAQTQRLYFAQTMGIPNAAAQVPPLLWMATRFHLSIFALKSEQITMDTPLYHAPFANTSAMGEVCMGNADPKIGSDCNLETFISKWESTFFGSYFTHTRLLSAPIEGNFVQFWIDHMQSGNAFPLEILKSNSFTVKTLFDEQ